MHIMPIIYVLAWCVEICQNALVCIEEMLSKSQWQYSPGSIWIYYIILYLLYLQLYSYFGVFVTVTEEQCGDLLVSTGPSNEYLLDICIQTGAVCLGDAEAQHIGCCCSTIPLGRALLLNLA